MDVPSIRLPSNFLFLFLFLLLSWGSRPGATQFPQEGMDWNGLSDEPTFQLVPASGRLRLCTPFIDECEQIVNLTEPGLDCVQGNGKIGCLDLIAKRMADFMPLHSEELYVASLYGRSAFQIVGEIRDRELAEGAARYSPVAVVRNSAGIRKFSDLRGKASCHTGYGRNAGWRIPFALLKSELACPADGPVYEKDLAAFSGFFSQACIGGNWVPEPEMNADLKKKYANLCSLCGGDCSPLSAHFGYEGAIRCLVKGADVAWTKLETVVDYFKLNSTPISIASQFSFLCLNGSTVPLTSPTPCSTSSRPWATVLTHTSVDVPHVQATLNLYSSIVDNMNVTIALEMNTTAQVYYRYEKPKEIRPYLGNYAQSFEKASCHDGIIRYCVANELELMKCNELRLAMVGQRVKPGIVCLISENCLKSVQDGSMDVVSNVKYLTAMEYTGGAGGGLTPLLSELRPSKPLQRPTPYSYSVALTKNRSIRNITELQGLKSCHGSINSNVGFRLPINYLRSVGLLKGGCSGFFNASCAPGAETGSEMCSLCVGDAADPTNGSKCADNEMETYYGDKGAIQCLLDGVADVAFVSHVTVLELIHDSNGNESLSDLKLICPLGGQMKLEDFPNCNWGKAPSRLVLTKSLDLSTRFALLKAAATFGGRGKPVMDLFGPWYDNEGLMFQENSVGLTDYDPSLIDPNVNEDPCRSCTSALSYSVLLILAASVKLLIAQ